MGNNPGRPDQKGDPGRTAGPVGPPRLPARVMQDRIAQICRDFKLPTMVATSVARSTAAGYVHVFLVALHPVDGAGEGGIGVVGVRRQVGVAGSLHLELTLGWPHCRHITAGASEATPMGACGLRTNGRPEAPAKAAARG